MEIDEDQENGLNNLDKYFAPKRITQIIGESGSLKESFISIYLANKINNTQKKVIFIYSKTTINIRYIYNYHLKQSEKINNEKCKKEYIESKEHQYLFFQFMKSDNIGDFIVKKLNVLLEEQKSVAYIVINNLNNFFSFNSYRKEDRILANNLLYLARKFNLNIIYLNDFFYNCETKFINEKNDCNNYLNNEKNNLNDDLEIENGDSSQKKNNEEMDNSEIEDYYNKLPILFDKLAEHCSHILIAENKKKKNFYRNEDEDDLIEEGEFKVIKSNYKPHQRYMITIDKKDFSYNIEDIEQ